MSAAVVGPLRVIRYADHTKRGYDLPRNPLDLRYQACASHHPACDCREAEMAEYQQEVRGEMEGIAAAFNEVLAGHSTYAPHEVATLAVPAAGVCMCTGCVIARKTHHRYFEALELHRAARSARRAQDSEWIPF